MDQSVFEKYINEMRTMKAAAVPAQNIVEPPVAAPSVPERMPIESEPNNPQMAGKGYLIVNVTSVRGLYPVEGARVTIFTGDIENAVVLDEVVTDRSGKTPVIELAAPSSVYAESPEPSERPYAYYNIRTIADGFIETLNYNVAVFDSVTSIQNVNLLPVTTEIERNRPIIIDGFDDYTL